MMGTRKRPLTHHVRERAKIADGALICTTIYPFMNALVDWDISL